MLSLKSSCLLGLGAAWQAADLPSQAPCTEQDSNPQQWLLEGTHR